MPRLNGESKWRREVELVVPMLKSMRGRRSIGALTTQDQILPTTTKWNFRQEIVMGNTVDDEEDSCVRREAGGWRELHRDGNIWILERFFSQPDRDGARRILQDIKT